jgi:hypothetical protein
LDSENTTQLVDELQYSLHRADSEQDVYDSFEFFTCALFGEVYGQLWHLDDDGDDPALLLVHEWGQLKASIAPRYYRVPLGEGIVGRAIQQNRTMLLDMTNEVDFVLAAAPDVVEAEELHYIFAQPWATNPQGVLLLGTRSDEPLSRDSRHTVMRVAPDVLAAAKRTRAARLPTCLNSMATVLPDMTTDAELHERAISVICDLADGARGWVLLWDAPRTGLFLAAACPGDGSGRRFVTPSPFVRALTHSKQSVRLFDVSKSATESMSHRGIFQTDIANLLRQLDFEKALWPDYEVTGRLLVTPFGVDTANGQSTSGVVVLHRPVSEEGFLPDDEVSVQSACDLMALIINHLDQQKRTHDLILATHDVVSASKYVDVVKATLDAIDKLLAPKAVVIASVRGGLQGELWGARPSDLAPEEIDYLSTAVRYVERNRVMDQLPPHEPSILRPSLYEDEYALVEVVVPIMRGDRLIGFICVLLRDADWKSLGSRSALGLFADHLAVSYSELELEQEVERLREGAAESAFEAMTPELFRVITSAMSHTIADLGNAAERLMGQEFENCGALAHSVRDSVVGAVCAARTVLSRADYIVSAIGNTVTQATLSQGSLVDLIRTAGQLANVDVQFAAPLPEGEVAAHPSGSLRELLRLLRGILVDFRAGALSEVSFDAEIATAFVQFSGQTDADAHQLLHADLVLKRLAETLDCDFDSRDDPGQRHVSLRIAARAVPHATPVDGYVA